MGRAVPYCQSCAFRSCLSVFGRYGVSYLVKDNYLYFHISSWKKSGKSAEVFGRCHAPPPFLPLAVPRSPSPPDFVVIASRDVTVLTAGCRAVEQALLDMQELCAPKKKMARKNSEQALDLLAH